MSKYGVCKSFCFNNSGLNLMKMLDVCLATCEMICFKAPFNMFLQKTNKKMMCFRTYSYLLSLSLTEHTMVLACAILSPINLWNCVTYFNSDWKKHQLIVETQKFNVTSQGLKYSTASSTWKSGRWCFWPLIIIWQALDQASTCQGFLQHFIVRAAALTTNGTWPLVSHPLMHAYSLPCMCTDTAIFAGE